MTQQDQCDVALEKIRCGACDRADAAAVVAELGRRIGCAPLALDEQGTTEITVDGEIDLVLLHLPHLPGLVAAAAVAEQAADDGALARRLLQANTSWEATQGGTFAMLPGRPELMLCRLIALAGRDVETLDRELAAFVELVRAWREEVEEDLEEAAAPAPPAPPPPDLLRV